MKTLILSLLIAASTVHASEYVYDSSGAQTLTKSQQAYFGPHSDQFKYDPRMIRAAQIAAARAFPQPTMRCWHYVKDALVAARLVSERPSTAWAKQAGEELCSKFGFRKLSISNPMKAPVGAVVVYGGRDAGHVELRTTFGFASDFVSRTPYPRPLIGVYVKDA